MWQGVFPCLALMWSASLGVRSCRYMDMTTAVSLVIQANKLPLSFSAQKDPMSVPLECIWYTLYVFPLTSKFQLSNFFPLLSPPRV